MTECFGFFSRCFEIWLNEDTRLTRLGRAAPLDKSRPTSSSEASTTFQSAVADCTRCSEIRGRLQLLSYTQSGRDCGLLLIRRCGALLRLEENSRDRSCRVDRNRILRRSEMFSLESYAWSWNYSFGVECAFESVVRIKF